MIKFIVSYSKKITLFIVLPIIVMCSSEGEEEVLSSAINESDLVSLSQETKTSEKKDVSSVSPSSEISKPVTELFGTIGMYDSEFEQSVNYVLVEVGTCHEKKMPLILDYTQERPSDKVSFQKVDLDLSFSKGESICSIHINEITLSNNETFRNTKSSQKKTFNESFDGSSEILKKGSSITFESDIGNRMIAKVVTGFDPAVNRQDVMLVYELFHFTEEEIFYDKMSHSHQMDTTNDVNEKEDNADSNSYNDSNCDDDHAMGRDTYREKDVFEYKEWETYEQSELHDNWESGFLTKHSSCRNQEKKHEEKNHHEDHSHHDHNHSHHDQDDYKFIEGPKGDLFQISNMLLINAHQKTPEWEITLRCDQYLKESFPGSNIYDTCGGYNLVDLPHSNKGSSVFYEDHSMIDLGYRPLLDQAYDDYVSYYLAPWSWETSPSFLNSYEMTRRFLSLSDHALYQVRDRWVDGDKDGFVFEPWLDSDGDKQYDSGYETCLDTDNHDHDFNPITGCGHNSKDTVTDGDNNGYIEDPFIDRNRDGIYNGDGSLDICFDTNNYDLDHDSSTGCEGSHDIVEDGDFDGLIKDPFIDSDGDFIFDDGLEYFEDFNGNHIYDGNNKDYFFDDVRDGRFTSPLGNRHASVVVVPSTTPRSNYLKVRIKTDREVGRQLKRDENGYLYNRYNFIVKLRKRNLFPWEVSKPILEPKNHYFVFPLEYRIK